jgi:hypothetical protein
MDYYRVIETDNFNGDYPNEQFATPYAMSKAQADEIAALFNKFFSGEHASRFWQVVPNDYELVGGFEP